MNKTIKFIALIITITMLFSVMSMLLSSSVYAENEVCSVGETKYTTITAAIDAIQESSTITLISNVENESITIPSNKNITLDLNANTLSSTSDTVITVASGATLTITGSGTVDGQNGRHAAIENNGTCTIEGGTITKSTDDSTFNNTYYVIENNGTMIIEGSAEVTTDTTYSACIDNKGTLTVNDSAQVSGGKYTIKNCEEAILTINGGTFTNSNNGEVGNHREGSVILNLNEATINGGTFTYTGTNTDASVICNDGDHVDGSNVEHDGTNVSLTITGGTFNSGNGSYAVYGTSGNIAATISISGGTFNGLIYISEKDDDVIYITGGSFSDITGIEDEAVYIPDGYEWVEIDGVYQIQKISDEDNDDDNDDETIVDTDDDDEVIDDEVVDEDITEDDEEELAVLPETGDIAIGALIAVIAVATIGLGLTFKFKKRI